MKRDVTLAAGLFVLLLLARLVEMTVAGSGQEIRRLQDRVVELEGYIKMQRYVGGAEIGSYRFPIHPDDYVLMTSPFGERRSPFTGAQVEHAGLDLAGVWRARIVSVADGVVVENWPPPDRRFKGHPIYGGMIKVKHDDGSSALYGHLGATYVHQGQRVAAGQIIGRQGESGRVTGQHLHFELEVGGRLVNPLRWLSSVGNEIPTQEARQEKMSDSAKLPDRGITGHAYRGRELSEGQPADQGHRLMAVR
jgi:murein DD-endopeptidase MepM/ murein hydrolase activator NlpD